MISEEGFYMTDTIIIGAGPAGISCALECVENRVETLVLERHSRIGGQLPAIPSPITNFSGGTYSNGSAFRNALEKTARKVLNGVVRTAVDVRKVDLAGKTIETDRGLLEGRTIVIATGYRVRELPLDLPDEHQSAILYKSSVHEEELRGRSVAIVGGGDSALLTALDLADSCREIHLLVRGDRFRARPDVLEKVMQSDRISVYLKTAIVGTQGDGRLESIELTGPTGRFEIDCDKVIVKIGYSPNTELFRGQLDMDDTGHIKIDSYGETTADGVFAAGDIVHNGYDRIAFANGSGVVAAKGVRRALGHPV